jgi:hypothetical protein
MATKANLVIDQGTDFSTTITLKDSSGSAYDLTGYSANGHIRKHYSSSTAYPLTCAISAPASTGKITLSLGRTTTSAMESGRYVYDVEIKSTSNTVTRLIEGIVTITPEVTRT